MQRPGHVTVPFILKALLCWTASSYGNLLLLSSAVVPQVVLGVAAEVGNGASPLATAENFEGSPAPVGLMADADEPAAEEGRQEEGPPEGQTQLLLEAKTDNPSRKKTRRKCGDIFCRIDKNKKVAALAYLVVLHGLLAALMVLNRRNVSQEAPAVSEATVLSSDTWFWNIMYPTIAVILNLLVFLYVRANVSDNSDKSTV